MSIKSAVDSVGYILQNVSVTDTKSIKNVSVVILVWT